MYTRNDCKCDVTVMLLHNSSDVRERGYRTVSTHTEYCSCVHSHSTEESTCSSTTVLHSNCSRSEYTSVVNYTVVSTVSCIYYVYNYDGNLQITMSHSDQFMKTNKLN